MGAARPQSAGRGHDDAGGCRHVPEAPRDQQVHALRHTFAKAMEDSGAKVSEIRARLRHSSLATTGRYLAALSQADNANADAIVGLFGIEGEFQ